MAIQQQFLPILCPLEFANVAVGKDGAKDWCQIAEHNEAIVEHGGRVIGEPQLIHKVQHQHCAHPVKAEPFAKFIAHNA